MTLEEARALILSFPEAYEDQDRSDGMIFRIRRKFFTRPVDGGESLLVTRVPYAECELLAELDPETYRLDRHRTNLLIRIERVAPANLKRLLEFCWRDAASKGAQRIYAASPQAFPNSPGR